MLLKKWGGTGRETDGAIRFCPACGAPVRDSDEALANHMLRVHSPRQLPDRFADTPRIHVESDGNGRLVNRKKGRPRKDGEWWLTEEQACLCRPCREGAHLLCDGDDCRCVCALELDGRRKSAPAARGRRGEL